MPDTTSTKIPEEPLEAMQYFAQRILDFDARQNAVERKRHHEIYLEYLTDLTNFAWNKKLRVSIPELTGIALEDISLIVVFCSHLIEELGRARTLNKFGLNPKTRSQQAGFRPLAWDKSDNDEHLLQRLINQQREIIQTSVTIPGSQQITLLRRLERLQSTLHKRKGRMRILDVLFDSD